MIGHDIRYLFRSGLPAMALSFMCVLLILCISSAQEVKVGPPVPVVPTDDKDKKTGVDKPAVPVVPLDKSDKKDGPSVISEENGGVLPWTFVKNRLETMPAGTKAFVTIEAVKCDSKRRVFLDPEQVYGTQNEGRLIMVHRDGTGYHITLDRVDHQWTCQELPPGVKWIPVKTVTSR